MAMKQTIPPVGLEGASFTSEWEWRTQTALPPPNGKISSNTGTWTGVTHLIISAQNHFGEDVSEELTDLAAGDAIKIAHLSDANLWSCWAVTGPGVNNAGYFSVPVTEVEIHGVPQANTRMVVTLANPAPAPPSTQLPTTLMLPDDGLYRVLSAENDLLTLQSDADKLILQGFAPVGGLNCFQVGVDVTFFQAFWRQNAAAVYVGKRP